MSSLLSNELAAAIERSRHADAAHNITNARLLSARRRQRKAWTAYRIRLTRLAVS